MTTKMPSPDPTPDQTSHQQDTKQQPSPSTTRRLLILSPTSHSPSTIPPLLTSLTGSSPVAADASFAGYTTHAPLRISNRYYDAEVPIWVDEIPVDGVSEGSGAVTTKATETPAPTSLQPKTETEEPTATPTQWRTEFSSPEAQVVRDAIGAVIITLVNPAPAPSALPAADPDPDSTPAPTPSESAQDRADVTDLKSFLKAIGDVRALIEEERGMGEVPGLVVLVDKGGAGAVVSDEDEEEPFSVAWWEEQMFGMGMMGFEVLRWDPRGEDEGERRNQFGELQGIRRVKEVLETHDWAGGEGGGVDEDDELERHLLGLDDGFDMEVNELEREMAGLKFAIGREVNETEEDEGDDELRVDAVEALLLRMNAIKDMSDELPETERKRFAAKAVRDIMKEI